MKKIISSMVALCLLIQVSAQEKTTPCARDVYAQGGASMNITGSRSGKGYIVPYIWIKQVNDTCYSIPHPDRSDPCLEVRDIMVDHRGIFPEIILWRDKHHSSQFMGCEVVITQYDDTKKWDILGVHFPITNENIFK